MWNSRRTLGLVAIAALLASVSSAAAQTADAALAATPALRHAARPRKELVWVGASVFAFSYLASAVSATTGYTADDGTSSERTPLWVPAVGPFVMMANTGSVAAEVLLAVDGVAQIGGLTMLVYGLSAPMSTRIDMQSGPHISVAPLVARGVSGAALVLTF